MDGWGVVMDFIEKNLFLVALLATSALMLVWPWIRGKVSGIGQLSPTEAVQLINRDDALVIDVREAKDFAEGHIPNARNIPLDKLAEGIKQLDAWKDKSVLVNCRSGGMSVRACNVLAKQGFKKINNLSGGMMAWKTANLPTEK